MATTVTGVTSRMIDPLTNTAIVDTTTNTTQEVDFVTVEEGEETWKGEQISSYHQFVTLVSFYHRHCENDAYCVAHSG